MTHEFKEIIEAYIKVASQGKKAVLATLVALNGSSYRKEGVRMLVLENQQYIGAVSGGCVEKEIISQAQSVFKTGISKMISYDGRYRLGCEGTLYLLLEELSISDDTVDKILNYLNNRLSFQLISYYPNEVGLGGCSFVKFGQEEYSLSKNSSDLGNKKKYTQCVKPSFQLYIVGVEHDAGSLSKQAAFLGWDIHIVNASNSIKTKKDFLEAKSVINVQSNNIGSFNIDDQTAVVLMNHSYAKDLMFLRALKNMKSPMYIGVLGAKKRSEQLLNTLLEEDLDVSDHFLGLIHGPTGLNIGAITPQEIAVSIVSQIISISRDKQL